MDSRCSAVPRVCLAGILSLQRDCVAAKSAGATLPPPCGAPCTPCLAAAAPVRNRALTIHAVAFTLTCTNHTHACRELVPRFMPWFQSAVQMLLPHQLPPGPVLVPCCGPGEGGIVPSRRLSRSALRYCALRYCGLLQPCGFEPRGSCMCRCVRVVWPGVSAASARGNAIRPTHVDTHAPWVSDPP